MYSTLIASTVTITPKVTLPKCKKVPGNLEYKPLNTILDHLF